MLPEGAQRTREAFCCPGPSRIQRLRYVNEALKAVDSPEKSTESNDGTFLNDGSVIVCAFFNDAILLLWRCYDNVSLENTRIAHRIRDITTVCGAFDLTVTWATKKYNNHCIYWY